MNTMHDTTESEGYPTFTGAGPAGAERSYVIEPEKAKIVNFAIQLGRPLLVEGEAGCGKTRLAHFITEELGLKTTIEATVRSSSRASDLLYRFDAIRRLQDSQVTKGDAAREARFAHNYVRLQPLGEAIQKSGRRVVLIDEIDKGDMDYPNDLLQVLDRFQFDIDEIPESESEIAEREVGFGHTVKGHGVRPIVLFTSNREKQLPKPFLRRCLYLELTFPEDPELLAEIVRKNLTSRRDDRGPLAGLPDISEEIIRAAVMSFQALRQRALDNRAHKPPATAELIDWVHILHWVGADVKSVRDSEPPYWQTLFSTSRDLDSERNHILSIQKPD